MKNVVAQQLSFDFDQRDVQAANDPVFTTRLFQRCRDPFYSSKGWRRARAYVLARDGASCRICKRSEPEAIRIDVDHIIPRHARPELGLVLSNLQVLCSDCHEAKSYVERLRGWRAPTARARMASRSGQ